MKNNDQSETAERFLKNVQFRTRKHNTRIAEDAGVSRVTLHHLMKGRLTSKLCKLDKVIQACEMTDEEKKEFARLFLPSLLPQTNGFLKPKPELEILRNFLISSAG